MEFKPASCPNCGGKLQLDPSNEKGNCPFCKSEIIVAEAIRKFKGEIDGIATQKSRLTRAEQMLHGGDYDGAIKSYKLLLDSSPENHEAWWGLFNCDVAVADFHFDRSGRSRVETNQCISFYREAIEQRGKWAIAYAPADKKTEYEAEINKLKEKIEAMTPPPEPEKKSGCYIATAVYGSYEAPEVLCLRRYRDETLAESKIGRLFIMTYYFLSPAIVKRLKRADSLNAFVRSLLDRVVKKLDDGFRNRM